MKEKQSLNIPNMLSIFRLCMVPVFVVVYFSALSTYYWALLVYAVAQGTDVIDGYIARKYNMITRLGRVLDPLADKLMSFTVLVCLVITHSYLWWAAVILFLKEILMGIGALVQYKRITDVPPSKVIGKVSTVYFYCMFIAIMLFPNMGRVVNTSICAVGVALTLIAFAVYVSTFLHMKKDTVNNTGNFENTESNRRG